MAGLTRAALFSIAMELLSPWREWQTRAILATELVSKCRHRLVPKVLLSVISHVL
jgi:hypothetical protein